MIQDMDMEFRGCGGAHSYALRAHVRMKSFGLHLKLCGFAASAPIHATTPVRNVRVLRGVHRAGGALCCAALCCAGLRCAACCGLCGS